MSSSTSSSDGRRFLAAFLPLVLGLCALVLATLLIVDPFATGRLSPLLHAAPLDSGPRKANAARIRDPQFNAAIIGNSTLQLLNPQNLDALTGLKFVQLTIPGTGPLEQNALVDAFMRARGEAIRAVIVGLDGVWCDPTREALTQPDQPFPFWLYDRSPLAYARGVFRMDSLEAVPRRLTMMAGGRSSARPDGFWDYERLPGSNAAAAPMAAIDPTPHAGLRHSADAGLAALLAKLPGTTRAVIVFPPTFRPAGHTPAAASEDAGRRCKEELAAVASRRGARIIDRRVDDATNRDPLNFMDPIHIRAPVARLIEADIARELAAAPP